MKKARNTIIVSIVLLQVTAFSAHAAIFTTNDLAGIWEVHMLASGDSPQRIGWVYGTASINTSGNANFTSVTRSNGDSTLPTDTPLSISSSGIVTIANVGEDVFHGVMNSHKDMIVAVMTGDPGDGGGYQLYIFTKRGTATYNTSDLGGIWEFHELSSGDSPQWIGWTYGTATIDISGNATFTSVNRSNGDSTPLTDTPLAISPTGIVTIATGGDFHGIMNSQKDMIVAVQTGDEGDGGGYRLSIGLKRGAATYSTSDLSGTWEVHELTSGDSPQWIGWMHGALNIDTTGNATFSSVTRSNGDSTLPMDVTFAMSSPGVVTAPDIGMGDFHGVMNSQKDMIVGVVTDGGGGYDLVTVSRGVRTINGYSFASCSAVPTNEFMPVTIGDSWVYNGFGEYSGYTKTEEFVSTELVYGVTCLKVRIEDPVEGLRYVWFAEDMQGNAHVFRFQYESQTWVQVNSDDDIPNIELKANPDTGDTWSRDFDGIGLAEFEVMSMNATVGQYDNCMKVRASYSGGGEIDAVYYKQGVGKVKLERWDASGGFILNSPPSPPTGVSATDGTYTDKVQVGWVASSGATSYEIWRYTSNSSGSASKIGDDTSSPYDDTSVVAGTTYWYWVKAVNSGGTSGFSNGDSGYRETGVTPPSPPTGVSATDGTYTDKVQVGWVASSGATSYEIWRYTSNSSGSASKIGDDTSSPYDDTSVVAGTTYWYWVKAVNSGGTSGFSNGDSGYRETGVTPPSPPTGVSATDGTYTDKVQVGWVASSGATSYEIWRYTSNSSGSASKIGDDTSSPYDDTSAVAGTTYWYWVKAVNSGGTSGFSNGDSGYPSDEKVPPAISGQIPEPDSIQILRDTSIQLHTTDGGSGVDFGTVTIRVEDDLIYDGANETSEGIYDSTGNTQTVRGVCTRSGTPADYTIVFDPSTSFDYEQKVDVTVNATDEAGNVMPEESYCFYAEMRSFAANAKVNSDIGLLAQNRPATAVDSAGNIWVTWDQTTATGQTDIYIGKLEVNGSAFGASVPVVSNANNQRNPAIAIDSSGRIYVAWEGNDTNGNWDIFVSTSTTGTNWSNPVQINTADPANSPSAQILPTIAIDGNNRAYATWEDERAGNRDIWVATSTDATNWTSAQVTTNTANQRDPAIAIDASNVVYVIWTDERNLATTGTDIYGADSGSWSNVPLINTVSNQSDPECAASGGVLHLLWVDDADANGSIFYASVTGGLQGTVVSDPDVTDERAYGQTEPAIAVSGTGASAKVFACWKDARYINKDDNADIYFTETVSSFGTNICVNDEGIGNTQASPNIGVDKNGNPYIVWVDDRNNNNDIFYAGAATINVLETVVTVEPDGVTVRASSTDGLQVQVTIPTGALPERVDASNITIAEVSNLPAMPTEYGGFGKYYEFGPSGLQFSSPVTIRMQHAVCPGYSVYRVYRYDPSSLSYWSQEGIHNPATHSPSGVAPHYLEVQVNHFSTFVAGGSTPAPDGGGGGGGGGCDMSPNHPGNLIGYLLPYALLSCAWLVIRRKDARDRGAL